MFDYLNIKYFQVILIVYCATFYSAKGGEIWSYLILITLQQL